MSCRGFAASCCLQGLRSRFPVGWKECSMMLRGTLNLTQFVFFKWLWAPTQILAFKHWDETWRNYGPHNVPTRNPHFRGLGSNTAMANVVNDNSQQGLATTEWWMMSNLALAQSQQCQLLRNLWNLWNRLNRWKLKWWLCDETDMNRWKRNDANWCRNSPEASSRETSSPSLNCTALSSTGNCSWQRHVKVQNLVDYPEWYQ